MSVRIGRYDVISELGRGGMGVVYRGEDPALGRAVAIKILPTKKLNQALVERFRREARAVAALDSPFVVRIYEYGEQVDGDATIYYIAMEFVEGRTLTEVIGTTQPPDAETLTRRLQIYWQLLHAMAYAHEQGVIHRDLKPDNVMVTTDDRVKVMDFGLAFFAGSHSLTNADQIMGTVAYFSPEQAQGTSKVDHRADIYSLGVILFELVTGRLPFDANHPMDMMRKLLQEPPRRPTDLNPIVSENLQALILRALEKDPGARFPSVGAMKSELERLISRGLVENLDPYAIPTPPSPPPRKPARKPRPVPEPEPEPEPPASQQTSVEVDPPNPFEQTRVDMGESAPEPGPEPPPQEPATAPEPSKTSRRDPYFSSLSPGIASKDWLNTAVEEAANDPEGWRAAKVQADQQLQERLMPESRGPRVICRYCHESNPPVSHCEVCGKELEATVYRDRRKARIHYENGLRAKRQNYLTQAAEELELAIEKDPDFGEAYLAIGEVFMLAGEHDEAVEALDQALDKLDDQVPALLVLADLYQRLGEPEEVMAMLAEAVQQRPADTTIRSRLAFMFQESGRTQEAMRQYRAVLRYEPENPGANRQLGLLLAAEEKLDEAIHYLEITCRLDPNDAHSCALLGRLYAKVRRFREAEEALFNALERDGNESELRAELGSLYHQRGLLNEAVVEYEKALALDQDQKEARVHLADIYLQQGQVDRALIELRHAITHFPQDVTVHRKLGETYLRLNRLDDAMNHFEQVVALDPTCAELRNRLGRIYLKKNYDEQSIIQYQEAIKLHPFEPEYHEDLGMAFYVTGEKRKAVKEIHKAATLNGQNPDYPKALGILLHELGEDEEAVRQLKWSLQLSPNDPQTKGILGQIYLKQRLTNMAITEFEGALAADPQQHLLLLYLARACAQAGKHGRAIEAFTTFSQRLEELAEDEFLGQAYVEMAGSYLAQGEDSRAAETFAAALARNPQDANALVGLARVALARGDHDQAARELHKAVAIRPRSGVVLEALAELHGERNEWDEAVAVLQRATSESPGNHMLHEKLGRSLRKAGRNEDAIGVFQRACLSFPRHRSQFQWLEGRVLGRMGRWGEAALLFRRALEEVPGNWRVLEDLAHACYRIGEVQEALEVIDEAIARAPESNRPDLRRIRANFG